MQQSPNHGNTAPKPRNNTVNRAGEAVRRAPVQTAKKQKDPNRVQFFNFNSKVDVPMTLIILVLLVFGITMMFSAGHAWAYRKNGDALYYIKHQLPAAGLGLVGMFLLTFFDYRFLRHEFSVGKHRVTLAHILLGAMLLLNALCFPFGVSNTEDGQKRWLRVPVFGTFQPSDFLKVAVIIFLAYYIHKNSDKIRLFWVGMGKPALLFLAVAFIMVVGQSHLSGTVIIFLIAAVMLFVGGINIKPAIFMIILGVGALLIAIQLSGFSYFKDRFASLDPLADIGDTTYQNYEAALAIASGGIWGKGFGNSSQKFYYLPEAQNDFVFAILVEEFGLIGGIVVVMLFLIFILRGFQIARLSEDKFGCLLATGITFQIGLQALLNIAVNVSAVPNTGVSLPFFSYGGTALMIQLWEMGLLLSVSKRARLK